MPTSDTYEKAKAINNDYRTAGMNRKYYACQLSRAKLLNFVLEVAVAIGTSAAVAAWSIWQNGPGAVSWKILGAGATVIAIVKPFLQLGKTIERRSELYAGWSALYFDLERLVIDMKTSKCVTDGCWQRYDAARDKMKELSIRDDLTVRKRLQRKCFEEVKREIPPDHLWWPAKEME